MSAAQEQMAAELRQAIADLPTRRCAPRVSAARKEMAAELRRVNPRRLLNWPGLKLGDGLYLHPYKGYCRAYVERAPREVQVAELLIGDVVADTLLLGEPEIRKHAKEAS